LYYSERLTSEDKEIVLDVGVRSILTIGHNFLSKIDELLPIWKETTFYDRGIMLSKNLLMSHAPRWRINAKLKSMEWPEYLPYDKDFIDGLLSNIKTYDNGMYPRIEFFKKNHIYSFLKDSLNVGFVSMKSRPDIHRSLNMPLLLINSVGNDESRFIGHLCGGKPVEIDGELMVLIHGSSEPILRRLGVIYDTVSNGIIVSPFYVMLFIGDMPYQFSDYWMGYMPHWGSKETRNGTLVATIHWRFMYGRKRTIKDGLPFLLTSAHMWNVGLNSKLIKSEVSRRRVDFIDDRIISRCRRWLNTAEANNREREERESHENNQVAK